MLLATVLPFLAGLAIPLGGLISANPGLQGWCRERELEHFMAAFGGGALLAAIALVMVPYAQAHLAWPQASLVFLAGGFLFFAVDIFVHRSGATASMFLAMLLDFIPESIALGATLTKGAAFAYLFAALILLQNLPEGFSSLIEMQRAKVSPRKRLLLFGLAPLAGPISAMGGFFLIADSPAVLAGLMLFCSGGILYLIFQDIAPQARLDRHWFPPLGAVFGFLLGLVGTMLVPGH